MAVRSKNGRRLRWLLIVGLAGAGAWIVRSRRAGGAQLWEDWLAAVAPLSPAAPAESGGPPVVEPAAGRVTGPEAAESDTVTPPFGIELPTVTTASSAVDGPLSAADARGTDAVVEPLAAAHDDARAADTEDPGTAGPGPAELAPPVAVPPPSPSGQALFSAPEVNGTEPAAATRPSPTPRPRPIAAAPDQRFGLGSAAPLPDGSAPGPEYTIKGNAGSMQFHRPDSPSYARTRAEVWFRTATDARAAGFLEWVPRNRAADRPTSS